MPSIAISEAHGPSGAYDAVVAMAGYQSRSIHVARELTPAAAKKLAFTYPGGPHDFSFSRNVEFLRSEGYEIAAGGEVGQHVTSELRMLERCASVAVDISCMTKTKLAEVVAALSSLNSGQDLHISFFYAFGEYVPAPELATTIANAQSINERFAGVTTQPELPLALLLGLGYERDKAIGALDYLEPVRLNLFFPRGVDTRFEVEVRDSNDLLLDIAEPDSITDYYISNWTRTLHDLTSLVAVLSRSYRVVIVPMGPKTFALAALIVALEYPSVSVWSFSATTAPPRHDVAPHGEIVQLDVIFRA